MSGSSNKRSTRVKISGLEGNEYGKASNKSGLMRKITGRSEVK